MSNITEQNPPVPGLVETSPMLRWLSYAPPAAAALVVLIGLSVLAGWSLEIDFLRRIVPGYVVMNPVSAIAFVLSSVALWLLQSSDVRRIQLAQACAASVLTVGLLKLCAVIGIFDTGIDQMLFPHRLFDNVIGQPTQMAPNTALNFFLFGLALLLFRVEPKQRNSFRAQIPAMLVLLTSFLAIIGYLYGARSFYVLVSFNPMAIHTAVSFLVLASGLLLSKPEQGLIKDLLSPGIGGQSARRLFPVVVLIPLALGWLQLEGERFGLYSAEIGFAMRTVAISIILGAIVLNNARMMNRSAARGKLIEKELSASQALLTKFVSHAPVAVAMLDTEMRYLQVSEQWLTDYNLGGQDIIGKSHYDVFSDIPDRWREIHLRCLAGAIESCAADPFPHDDGTIEWLQWETRPWHTADGEIGGVIFFTQVVTKRKQIELELETAHDAALESVRLKAEFLANMSHEIRTPMNGVIGMSELLLSTDLSDRQQEFTKAIETSADALLRIIDDILDFTKMESGQLRFENIEFDLREIVESSVEMHAARAQDKNVEIASLVYLEAPSLLKGDPGRMRQILTNLIGNAIKFTEKGEVVVNVVKESETKSHVLLRFEIKDTGIGISEDAVRKLFHPFVQADGSTTRKFGGTGLGLAISRQLVELMGGKIGVESMPDEGSTFWFTAWLEKQLTPAVKNQPALAASLAGIRVLIVDDNETNRNMLRHQTTAWGMIVTEAESGARALDLLRGSDQSFDIAILDLIMPDMNGFDLARIIKADPEISRIPLVLLPSFGKSGHDELAREIGIAAYLQKPVRQLQLHSCLAKVMAESSIQSGNHSQRQVMPASLSNAGDVLSAMASSVRILVAEDLEINRAVVLNQLQGLGYSPDAVQNGREAVEALKNQKYDVVLMDCQMPEMDGFEATAEIRRHENNSNHTVIIAITANALTGDREKCLAAGMDDYLSKPVKIEALQMMLTRWTAPVDQRVKAQLPTAVTGQKNSLAIVDVSILNGYRFLQRPGMPDIVTRYIDLFIDGAAKNLSLLGKSFTQGDIRAVKREAHSIKGSAGVIGACRMAAISSELEQKAHLSVEAKILISQLHHGFEEVREILDSMRQG